MLVGGEVGPSVLGSDLARPLQAVSLFVGHGAAVLASAFPVFGGNLASVDPLFVPLVDARVGLLPVFLGPLVLEGGPLGVQVPWRIGDVLRDVGVDILATFVDGGGGVAQLSLFLQLLLFLEVIPRLLLINYSQEIESSILM